MYSDSINPLSPAVEYLWQTLESFNSEERQLFLKFVWGRSRLPLREEDFIDKFTIEQIPRDAPDSHLPTSHT